LTTKKEFQVDIDKKGNFKFLLNLDTIYYGKFEHGDEYTSFCLYPGDEISLSIDTKQFDETVTYKGKGSEKNNYLAEEYLLFHDEKVIEEIYRVIVESTPESFNEYSDSLITKHDRLIKKYKDKANNKDDFWKISEMDFLLRIISFQDSYNMFKSYYGNTEYQGENYEKMNVAFPKLHSVDLNQEKFTVLYTYLEYVSCEFSHTSSMLEFKTYERDINVDTFASEIIRGNEKTYKLQKLYLTGTVRELVTFNELKMMIENSSVEQYSECYNDFINTCTNQELITEINILHNVNLKFEKGQPAPDFELIDILGKNVKLSDFRGKVVYIDFWASWCGPCIMEFPYTSEIHNEFKDEDIVFMYISIDDDKEKWLGAVLEYKIEGIHLNCPRVFESEVGKQYRISGVPRCVIIDKEGNIFNKDAPHPSSDKIRIELKEALNKE